MVKRTNLSDLILVAIWITMLTAQSEIQPLFNKLGVDFDEFLGYRYDDTRNN